MSRTPLFSFTSRLDGKNYDAFWGDDDAVIRVDLQIVPNAPTIPGSYSPPPPPVASFNSHPIFGKSIEVDLVRAFEEGRLSHPDHESPYVGKTSRSAQATAWAFGALVR